MEGHIFISYARADESDVHKLYNDLIKAGVDCWLDVENIPSGANWDEELQKAIESCSHVIVVCTPNSMGSRNVTAEWHYAFELKKSLHPIILQPCEIPFRLRIYQHIDAIKAGYVEALKELISVLPSKGQGKIAEASEEPATHKIDALVQRAVANWRSFGLLPDPTAFNRIDQSRDQLIELDTNTLELLFLSARHNQQSIDYWLQRIKQDQTALSNIENILIDQIDETFSYQRQVEFEMLASQRLLNKFTQLIKLTDDPIKLSVLLDSAERMLLKAANFSLDLSELEAALLVYFEQQPSQVVVRALGWINSQVFLKQSLDKLKGQSLSEIYQGVDSLYLYSLVYMTQKDAVDFLKPLTPEGFCYIPSGWFVMGREATQDRERYDFAHEVFVPSFWLTKTLVTQQQYALFSGAGSQNLPVHNIHWLQAREYALWLGQQLELPLDLPTEAMWEKAASWHPEQQSKLHFPWGEELDFSRCNTIEGKYGRISPVGMFSPQGDSPYGLQDMVGNVWEWTSSSLDPYPYHARDGREHTGIRATFRVLRGVSYKAKRGFQKACVTRLGVEEDFAFNDVGFRVAIVIAR